MSYGLSMAFKSLEVFWTALLVHLLHCCGGPLFGVSAGGNTAPQVLSVWAAQPVARDLSSVDQRPISSTGSGQFYYLS
jgi:hypothetical protein